MVETAVSSRRWLSWLVAVGALAASEIAVAAIAGVGGIRLAVVAAAAGVFALSYAATPSPCKCTYDKHDLRPIVSMIGAVVVAMIATGGIASPLLAMLPAPFMMGWMMFHKSREAASLGVLVPIILGGLLIVPECWLAIDLDRYVWLAAWTTLLSATLISRRIRRLFYTLKVARGSLDRVRNGALSDAESRRRGMETMTTKLAHELKNPLAAIKSLVQLELRRTEDEKSKKRLEVVFSEAERMQALLKDYLSFARPVDDLDVGNVELAELMAEVGELLTGRAEAAGIELSVKGTGGAMRADSRRLKEALVNVAANALEATPRGGTVDVTYHVGSSGTNIVVRDTGKGMAPEVRARIGTPFFTTRDDGTGLGVVIAQTAIRQHHGTLEYASTPGVGTIATIAIPVQP
jgi:two-component system, NtrC family, sensor histidine kinase HydH